MKLAELEVTLFSAKMAETLHRYYGEILAADIAELEEEILVAKIVNLCLTGE
jgi:hypothetical protein